MTSFAAFFRIADKSFAVRASPDDYYQSDDGIYSSTTCNTRYWSWPVRVLLRRWNWRAVVPSNTPKICFCLVAYMWMKNTTVAYLSACLFSWTALPFWVKFKTMIGRTREIQVQICPKKPSSRLSQVPLILLSQCSQQFRFLPLPSYFFLKSGIVRKNA